MQLKSLTYTSRARLDLSDKDLSDIHESARHLNALDGVTGLLVFDGVRFLQIIEGPEDSIDKLVERLRRDRRHSAFEIRDEHVIDSRSFPDWSMELVRVSAGFREARIAISSILPETTSPTVRDIASRMADDLSSRS
jgi:hypothetical protein